jgi:hypothetical protein
MERARDSVGARSISDFARMAARRLIRSDEGERMEVITGKLEVIDSWIDRLKDKMQLISGAANNAGNEVTSADNHGPVSNGEEK